MNCATAILAQVVSVIVCCFYRNEMLCDAPDLLLEMER